MRTTLMLLFLVFVCMTNSLAQSAPVKLEGQIVCCLECWNRADRKTVPYGTPADLAKASECIGNGDPTLLAVTEAAGATIFYQLEDGKYKKPGPNWLELVGSRVTITGPVRVRKTQRFIKVDALQVSATAAQVAPAPQVVGTEVELALKDLFGVEQKLSSFRGRIVVLNFWATYCKPCLKEMPDLAAIQNQYAALGVQVIGASAETLAEQKLVRKFITDLKINFPVWLGANTEDMARFGLGPALPGTVVIGRDGKIVALHPGVIQPDELKKQLDTLIAQAQQAAKSQIASAKQQLPNSSSVPS